MGSVEHHVIIEIKLKNSHCKFYWSYNNKYNKEELETNNNKFKKVCLRNELGKVGKVGKKTEHKHKVKKK
jgi:hypothetical protein